MKRNIWTSLITVAVIAAIVITSVLIFSPRIEVQASPGKLSLNIGLNTPEPAKPAAKQAETEISAENATITFKRWGGDSTFSLLPYALSTSARSISGDSVYYDNSLFNLEIKPTPIGHYNDYGGYDLFITIKSKILTNTLPFKYDSTNVKAHIQPPLTELFEVGQKELHYTVGSVTDSEVRATDGTLLIGRNGEHVTNSICFYRETKTFTKGKIGTLYRVKAFNSKGDWVWCDWEVDGATINLVIPPSFLNSNYPITITPIGDTFGYTDNVTSDFTSGNVNYIIANYESYSPDNDGTVDNITAFVGSVGGNNVQAGFYTTSSNLTDNTTSFTPGASRNWCGSTNVGGATVDNATSYYLGINVDNADCGWQFDWGDAGEGYRYYSVTFGTWPDPIGSWSFNTNTERHHGIFVAYTADAGDPSANVSPTTENIGTVEYSTTYYAYGSAPSNPVQDGECIFTLQNDGSVTINTTISMEDLTAAGEQTYTLVTGSPSTHEFRITAYYSGQDPASGVVLTNAAQTFYNGLTANSTIKFDFKLDMGTWDAGSENNTARNGVLQITAVAP